MQLPNSLHSRCSGRERRKSASRRNPFNYQRRRKSRVACDGRPGFRRDNSADGPPINSPYSREIICRALSLGNGQAGLAATSRGDFPSSARNQFEKLNLAIVGLNPADRALAPRPASPADFFAGRLIRQDRTSAAEHRRVDRARPAFGLLRGIDGRLNQSAEEALGKWEFYPATRNGQPVDVDVVVEIPFRLEPLAPKP
jgi:hypothetical protein